MKNKIMWLCLSLLLAASMLAVSCATSTTTSTPVSTTVSTTKTITTPTTTSTISTIPTTTPTTTTATGKWWDSLGTPQYGGTLTLRSAADFANFDPYNGRPLVNCLGGWMETLFEDGWTTDPLVCNFRTSYAPFVVDQGFLMQSWEFSDPNTIVLHLHQNVYWQNIAPANGRKFVASDVVYHFNRMMGLGDGFTTPAPWWGTQANWLDLQSVTATDNYTVAFKWKTPNPESIEQSLTYAAADTVIENPEAVKLWGNLNDWHHAIGTGSFILKDFVSSSSMTLDANPNYWGTDERYPQNKLPYIQQIKILIMPDTVTAEAGLRSGKIDFLDSLPLQDAQSIKKTNPSILQIGIPLGPVPSIDPRNDKAPFNDIRVREALQKAIDLPTIASTYYSGTCDPWPSTLISNYVPGWGLPYPQWPQDLKDQYAYDPTVAKQLLAAAGYPNGFNTNLVCQSTQDIALFEIVRSYFAAVGVNMSIKTMDPTSFTNFVMMNHSHDALSSNVQGLLGRQGAPLTQLMLFYPNTANNTEMVNDPVFNAFYPAALAATSVNDSEKVSSQAAEYVARQHFTISLLNPVAFALYQPWLKGYSGQSTAISGPGGPIRLGFFGARFWIDQNLKTSKGY